MTGNDATSIDLSPHVARRALEPLGDFSDDEDAVERYATVVWSQLIEPGDSVAGRLIVGRGASGALTAVLNGSPLPEIPAPELGAALKRWRPRLSAQTVADGLRIAGAHGVTLVTPRDPEWPSQLDDLDDHRPLCLWVRGDSSTLRRLRPSVAIVGARAATPYGDQVSTELASELAGAGVPVVSGGAYGIDGAAHRGALLAGGLTVALLAGGADRAYPAGHTRLLDDIARFGAVVSEVPCGSAPTKWRFLQRNRIISAISDATIVVEAGWRSGSLNTAGHAAALGRELGAVPGPITSAASAGTHRLLREYGAQCITGAPDVRELLGLDRDDRRTRGAADAGGPPQGSSSAGGSTDDATRVLDALSTRAWRDAPDIARRAGMAPAQVEAILGLLHLEGAVTSTVEGWRRVVAGP